MNYITFSPLAGSVLTDRYLQGIPDNSRIASGSKFLTERQLTQEKMEKVRGLQTITQRRGQKLAQMALSWVLRDSRVTSVLIPVRPSKLMMRLICCISRH